MEHAAQSPILNPQSPIPNPHYKLIKYNIKNNIDLININKIKYNQIYITINERK